MRRPAVLTVAVSLAVPAVAGAAGPGRDRPDQVRLERQAIAVLNDATRRVQADHPSCRTRIPRHRTPAVTDAPVDPAIASVIGLFRRPGTPEERAAQNHGGYPGTEEVYRDGVRFATSAGGVRFKISVQSRVRRFMPDAATLRRCARLARARLRGRPAAVRRARAILDAQRDHAADEPEVARGLVVTVGNGSGGSLYDQRRFVEQGSWMSQGPGPAQRGESRLFGLVPDGVAKIVFDYPRYAGRGPYRRARDYRSPLRREAVVRENVVSIAVPREAGDALAPEMTWLGPGGAVVRVVRRDE